MNAERTDDAARPPESAPPPPMTQSTRSAPPKGAGVAPRRPRRRVAWIVAAIVTAGSVGALLVRQKAPVPQAATGPEMPRADGKGILLSPAIQERLGVRTAPVRQKQVTPVVRVAGMVAFDPKYVAAVGTRLKGLVRSVRQFEGDRVKSGTLLAEIDSPELGSAQASVLAYRAQYKAAQLNLKREQDLASRGLTTTREVELASAESDEYRSKLIAAEQQVAALGGGVVTEDGKGGIGVHQLRSPLTGTVVERHVNAGQSVEGHLTAFRVADLDHLWVELAVFERHLHDMDKSDRVELSSLSNPDDKSEGQIAYVGEQVDPATRTATVRVEVDNRARKLRPGQAVTARVHLARAGGSVTTVVPQAAVTYVDGKPTVFVAESDTRFVATPVTLGDSDAQDQEIDTGLRPGQHVVTEGVFALKSELFR
jgi:membrane fusion protein, heavy metal efflux system